MIDIKIPENLKERRLLKEIIPFLDEENILLLTGIRQSGKTSLLYLLLNFLLKKRGVSPSQIVFYDLENILESEALNSFRDFNEFILELEKKGVNSEKKAYVFIDEVTYLKHPSGFLKYLYDHYRQKIKFIVSASSSLDIKQKFTDRLTGRIYRFQVKTLDFEEFLLFKNENDLWKTVKERKGEKPLSLLEEKKLRDLFEEFSVYGGFPGVTLKKEAFIKERDLKEIYSLYVRRDIKDIARIADAYGFNKLTGLLSAQIGNLVNESELSSSSALSRATVRKYLFILENTFVLKLLSPFYTNLRSEFVKMPKVYFEDNGLRNAVLENFTAIKKRSDMGALIENACFHNLCSREQQGLNFWRSETKLEVDFIIKKGALPIEVKYQSFKSVKIPSGLASFLRKYPVEKGIVVTRDFLGQKAFGRSRVLFIPGYLFPFMLENLLKEGLK